MIFHRRDAEFSQRIAEIYIFSQRFSAVSLRLCGEIYLDFDNWQLGLNSSVFQVKSQTSTAARFCAVEVSTKLQRKTLSKKFTGITGYSGIFLRK